MSEMKLRRYGIVKGARHLDGESKISVDAAT